MPLRFTAPPKAFPLIGYLLLNRKAPVDREQLTSVFWPDDDEAKSRANLRRHLSQLQHVLNPSSHQPPVIVADGKTVQWNPLVPLWFDVEEFERLSASPASLDDAVHLYTGDLMDTVHDEWVFRYRERLRLLYIADLDALAFEHRSRRDFKGALTYIQQALRADSWREDAIRQSMNVRFELGDRAGALAEYLDFAKRLRMEMDLDPMPETVAAYEAIRRNTSVLERSGTMTETDKRAKSAVLPFTGRQEILSLLTARWSQAARGHGNVVLLSGEAGIGKSRIAAELALLAEAEGARVLMGAAAAVESSPYDAVSQALRMAIPLYPHLKLAPVWHESLSALLPELRRGKAPVETLPALAPGREELRLFEAVAQLLLELTKTRPVLLVVEDVHLAGTGTANLLGYLARRVSEAHLLIVISYRDEEVSRAHPVRALRRLLEEPGFAKHVSLGPLSCDTVALIAKARGVPELAEQLFADSEGNPFFLTEMLRSHAEGATALGTGIDGIPAWILKRAASLSERAQSLVEAAAVIGANFDVELLKEVCGWDESALLDALDELLDRQLIRESAVGASDFAFGHHLIHAAIYDRCSVATKKRRHRRIARALCELYPARLDDLAPQIAFHLANAGQNEAAAPYYLRAARSAQRLFANRDAVEFAGRGLAGCTDASTRIELSLLLESLYARIGDRTAQAEQLAALERDAAGDEVTRVRSNLLLRRIAFHHSLGDRAQEAAALIELDALQEDHSEESLEAARHVARALYHKALGENAPAITAARRALALQSADTDLTDRGTSHCLLAELYSGDGRYHDAAAELAAAREVANLTADTVLLARVLSAAVKLEMDERNFTSARDAGAQLLALFDRIGDREGAADAHAGLGAAIGRAFDVTLAETHYRAAAELYRALGKQQGEAVVFLNVGTLRLLTGDCSAALLAYESAKPIFRSLKDVRGELLCELNSSLCSLYLGDPTAAAERAHVALCLARTLANRSLEAHALANLGAAERDRGQYAAGIAHMTEGIAIRRTLNEGADLLADLCDLGLAYLDTSDLTGAAAVLETFAQAEQHDVDQMMFPQYFDWVKSTLLGALGRDEESQDALRRAYAEYKRRLSTIPDKGARPMYRWLPFNDAIGRAFERRFGRALDAAVIP